MNNKIYFLLMVVSILSLSCSNDIKDNASKKNLVIRGEYLGQKPPGQTPKLFAPGIISSGFHDMNITFSPDLKEIAYTRSSPFDWFSSIIHLKKNKGEWSSSELAGYVNSKNNRYSYPFFSPDGKKIFYNCNTPVAGLKEARVNNIWVSTFENNKWSTGTPLKDVNTDKVEMYPSVSASGTLFFSANFEDAKGGFDIYYSEFVEGKYEEALNAGHGINTEDREFHSFIAPDESYLIFDRIVGGENMDLFISYKNKEGNWTRAVNMGTTINHKNQGDMRPYVTPDGKYLFFSSTRTNRSGMKTLTYSGFMDRINGPGNLSQDIYWVDAGIIEDLKPEELKK